MIKRIYFIKNSFWLKILLSNKKYKVKLPLLINYKKVKIISLFKVRGNKIDLNIIRTI